MSGEYSSMKKNGDVMIQAKPLPMSVSVTAPSDLAGGYEFTVDVDGKPTVVRVPEGGVREGQNFVATVVKKPNLFEEGHRVPSGQWRDGICNCFSNGLFHPMVCLACWCQPLALGQVMTRLKLNALGKISRCGKPPSNDIGGGEPMDDGTVEGDAEAKTQYWTAFKVLAVIFASYIAIYQALDIILEPYDMYERDAQGIYEVILPIWVYILMAIQYVIELAFFLYILFLTIRSRSYIRERYNIPEQNCRGCEDCCYSFWMPCCTISQMARHTADYEYYQASLCTDTGLPGHAPLIV